MIGLVLVTHGRLAAEFVAAMEHVVGAQDRVEPICIAADDDMELFINGVRFVNDTNLSPTTVTNIETIRAAVAR